MLTFKTFDKSCQGIYYIELTEEAWGTHEPRFDLFIQSITITKVFGLSAHVLLVPVRKVGVSKVQVYQCKRRVGMGYNAITMVYECLEVMNFLLK